MNNNGINNSRGHFLNNYVPETVKSFKWTISFICFSGPLGGGYKYTHLTEEVSEAQRS